MTTRPPLRILILEDAPSDLELIVDELHQAGLSVDYRCVMTEADYSANLGEDLDLILADYRLPQFDALKALRLLQERKLDIPLIVVTGTIGEEAAAECIKLGATDYLLKDRLARLGQSVKVALEAKCLRDENRRAEAALWQSQMLNRAVLNSIGEHIAVLDQEGTIVAVNEAWTRFARENGDPALAFTGIGTNYLAACQRAAEAGDTDAGQALTGIQAVLHASQPEFRLEYACHSPQEKRWFLMRASRLAGGSGGAVVSHTNITERRLAEEAVKADERRFRKLIENSADVILLIDGAGKILYESPAVNVKERFQGAVQNLLQALHPDDVAFYTDFLKEVMRQPGKSVDLQLRVRNRQGSWTWIEGTATNLLDDPDVQAVIVNYRDVTERKRVEIAEREQRILAEALRDTASALANALLPETVTSSILENVGRVVPHDAANIMYIEGDTIRAIQWRGYPPSLNHIYSTQRFRLEDIPNYHDMMLSGEPCLIVDTLAEPGWVDLALPEGSWIRSYVSSPIKARGQVIGFLNLHSRTPGFFTPLHVERLRAFADQAAAAIEHTQLYEELRRYARELEKRVDERTAELHRAKEHVEVILDSSSDAIVVIRPEGAVKQTNPAFGKLFGYQFDEAVGRSITKFAAPGYEQIVSDTLQAVLQQAQPWRIEIVAHRADRTPFDADIGLSPIIGEDGNVSAAVCSIRDITERKRAEKELHELNRLKTEFLSTAAHELRTPLTTIRGFSEILLTRSFDSPRQTHYLTLINEQATVLGQLIDDLLNISRLEAKRDLTLNLVMLDIPRLFQEVVVPFIESSPRHQIWVEGLPAYPPVQGDPIRLAQILKNLLSNAVKYSPRGGSVIISCRVLPRYLQISVQDEGIGIWPEQQAHLFEQFYRADASNTAIQGTGLGLVICKLIVELHGGKIWVESEYGRGSTFHFTLPLMGGETAEEP